MEITDSSGTYSTIASAVTFVVLALITSTASHDDDSFCLTSLLISVMMSDSSHCQNRTIYKLAYRYGAVGSIVLLHAWLYTLLYTLYTLYTLSCADKAVNVRWWQYSVPCYDVAGSSLPPPRMWMTRLCRWSSLAPVLFCQSIPGIESYWTSCSIISGVPSLPLCS